MQGNVYIMYMYVCVCYYDIVCSFEHDNTCSSRWINKIACNGIQRHWRGVCVGNGGMRGASSHVSWSVVYIRLQVLICCMYIVTMAP